MRVLKVVSAAMLLFEFSLAQDCEEWYLYTPDRFNLYMCEFGTGDTVVVLHGGFGAEHSYLLDAFRPLADRFHFIMFDQRGSLRSPAAESLLTFERILEDVESIRRELRLERLTLIAHSMGTLVAMAYADRNPGKVDNLVLLGSAHPRSISQTVRTLAVYYMQNRPEVGQEQQTLGVSGDTSGWSMKQRTYDWRLSFASVNIFQIDKWRRMRGGVAFYNQRAGNLIYESSPREWDYIPSLSKARYPITVISGDHDYLDFTAKTARDLLSFYLKNEGKNSLMVEFLNVDSKKLEQIPRWSSYERELPNLQVRVIERAGHQAWIDQPDKFRSEVESALLKSGGRNER